MNIDNVRAHLTFTAGVTDKKAIDDGIAYADQRRRGGRTPMNPTNSFELTMTAGAGWGSPKVYRYRRWHGTFEEARDYAAGLAGRIAEKEGAIGRVYIVYGPGCGRDGLVVA